MRLAAIWRWAGAAASTGFWLAFPVVPVLAGDFAFHVTTMGVGDDPHEWQSDQWWFLAGPLFGYGFLAGATWGVADEPGGRWWRAWATRRAAWVGLGPWLGLWAAAAAGMALGAARWALEAMGLGWPAGWAAGSSAGVGASWAVGVGAAWAVGVAGVATLAFGWAVVGWAALRRSRRAGGPARAGVGPRARPGVGVRRLAVRGVLDRHDDLAGLLL